MSNNYVKSVKGIKGTNYNQIMKDTHNKDTCKKSNLFKSTHVFYEGLTFDEIQHIV